MKLLFGFDGTISRREYFTVAAIGVVLKQVVDRVVAAFVFHREWTPVNYVMPMGIPVPLRSIGEHDRLFLVSMLAVAVPFAWVGVAITAKRFRAIGWPAWLVVLFFVPVANVFSFLVAAAWPDHERDSAEGTPSGIARFVPSDGLGAAVFALAATVALGGALVAFVIKVAPLYGWGMFAAIPFLQGALATFISSAHRPRSLGPGLSIALLSVALTAACLLVLAFEGLACILMAAPIGSSLQLSARSLLIRSPAVRAGRGSTQPGSSR
ncbi:MAG: DUF805 domain-containing protein [Candidatus Eremiobacteraeota bacterium]|nr:DUF805 domain-containing protein [Candidatus Eremiobacteraeota bacterium]